MVLCFVCLEKTANYNYYGNSPEYCGTCKEDGMVNVRCKRCENEQCNKMPVFNLSGETRGRFCKRHKKTGMVNVREKKRCHYESCYSQPSFNFPGSKQGQFCKRHALDGMIDVKNKRCEHQCCNSITPVFNVPGSKQGKYCKRHALEGMINVISKKCKTPLCDTIVTNKYKGYCFFCFRNIFPDHEYSRNYKTKELEVSRYVREEFSQYDWVCDKIVDGGCSRRRPDLLCDFGNQVLIVEVDENQHTDYDTTCETVRLEQISEDVQYRPVIFIRFNPDGYYIKEKKIFSCWKMKNGKMSISRQKDWGNRLEALKKEIKYWSENNTDERVKIIQMFYDE